MTRLFLKIRIFFAGYSTVVSKFKLSWNGDCLYRCWGSRWQGPTHQKEAIENGRNFPILLYSIDLKKMVGLSDHLNSSNKMIYVRTSFNLTALTPGRSIADWLPSPWEDNISAGSAIRVGPRVQIVIRKTWGSNQPASIFIPFWKKTTKTCVVSCVLDSGPWHQLVGMLFGPMGYLSASAPSLRDLTIGTSLIITIFWLRMYWMHIYGASCWWAIVGWNFFRTGLSPALYLWIAFLIISGS